MTRQQAENTIKVAGIIVGMILWAVPVVLAIGIQYQRINNISDCQREDKVKIESNNELIIQNQKEIIGIKADVKHIREGVDDIKVEIRKE